MSTMVRRSLPIVLLLVAAPSVLATTRSVRPDGLGTYGTIQAAVDASLPGDQVVLATGTFRGVGNCNVNFRDKAITIRSTDPASSTVVAATIVDCGGSPYNYLSDECRRGFVLTTGDTSSSILSGITIINGQTVNGMRYWPPDAEDRKGGAVYCANAGATIRNCVFRDCWGTYGAAIYGTGGQLLIENCTFTDCRAFSDYGWGVGSSIDCLDSVIRNCTLDGSDMDIAGTSTVSGCTVRGACGIRCSGDITISDCTVTDNGSTSMNTRSPGIEIQGGTATIANCIIDGNTMSSWNAPYDYDAWGSGLVSWGATLTVTDSRITRNSCYGADSARGFGAGLFVAGGSATVTGCTIAGNSADAGSGLSIDGNASLRNCIVWDNGTDPYSISSSIVLTTTYSDVQGGMAGEGNINVDPQLSADSHLRESSPCANAGDPAYSPTPGETDIDGDPRVLYGQVDIGADERITAADVDGDGRVNVIDLLVLADAWASRTGEPAYLAAADLDEDGAVDVMDLLIFAKYWG